MTASQTSQSRATGITGSTFDLDAFRFFETDRFDPQLVFDVIEGRRAGIIFRKFISELDCSRIRKNFWNHPDRYTRGADVPAECVGSFHYRKTLDRYFAEVRSIGGRIDQLFFHGVDPVTSFVGGLEEVLTSKGMEIRQASHNGRSAGRFVMRSWADTGAFALEPHDDEAQCSDPVQAGFEIQDVSKNALVAVNICVENGSGGALNYWNMIPDASSRDRLGLTFTGHPYPIEELEGIDYQVVQIQAGDLYCFNGKAIHAVSALAGSSGRRATIAFLMGQLNDREVICWT